MKNNRLRECIGLISGINTLFILGAIILEMNKGVIETPKYYSSMISLFFWAIVTILCFYDVQESFLPTKISFFLNQPYHFSYISTLISILSFVIFFVSVISLFYTTDEFTDKLRIKTEEQNYCCVFVNDKPFSDCGCYKYEGKMERTIGFLNRIKYGKNQIVHCSKCRLTSYKFVFLISQSVNVIGSILILLLSYLHYSIEKEWFALSEDEKIQLDEAKFVDDKIFFIKQLLIGQKQKNE
ncbi:hypothetical protein EHI8A_193200 [Entamoeba histolytica HM-1:IMSS-B]|uniref:Uncharacterized protein n=6 Tax=Entamoeba histolytica TaxID=5759 RepID=C4MBE4_ENTH1|nr:hypothetical protein EHI_060760 [Entamoeba histolytica HM-1:IMSS]EMD42401.1 Hypothetical protein EHI5A_219590 [Entamoeba histolytica KU27]EMH75022.1 hypothetical protein EHI8A_193200 [Entamoeba histolytica HM-1:IMSS-B]EMS15215.1 hypothetical protein KM1_270230 [Entamoeba histolytica HM-3:IMSS]ENY64680.1 hypothetical protein EHI7A_169950 [Entamoeba histolytica HM-1:IMSS-A]GAT99296.1 hypothetical protein CL6EHI_060760 [Entamoeba histolytica]|eukprot:XP_648034.2 hypothetical protein EHI_060760 [Entamoeba histolytica HM-1:IMSS]